MEALRTSTVPSVAKTPNDSPGRSYMRTFNTPLPIHSAVVAGVEDVVLALALEHRAGEDELVLLVVAAARDRHAAVTVVDEVLGGGEVPAERFGVAVVPLVEQEELVALAERHAITWPAKGDVATPSLMKPMMSEQPRANPRASAL